MVVTATLDWVDYLTLVLYFVVVMAVGLWSTFRPNRDTSEGYFLAGKNMHWFPVGASIFASNVGAPMFIGLAGSAAASGFAVAIFEWHAVYLLIALGWVFVPTYVASGAFTMPEYLKLRFGGKRLRIYLSILALILYVLAKISAEIFAGAIFLQQILNWDLYLSVFLILAVTGIYTVAGGLAAVMYTDTLQTIILLVGSIILLFIGFAEIGDWESMLRGYSTAASAKTLANPLNHSCGLPREDAFHVFRDAVEGDYPWPGMVIGLTFLGMWVWCNDQIMVQRCLAAKNMINVKAGSIFAGILKIFPFFLFIIPGMISRILYPEEVACADPDDCERICNNKAGCTNIAYPLLVLRIMPSGLRGIMLAALLAALMSSLTSIFNSASSMFTMDVYTKIRPKAKESELMIVGRACVLVEIGLSILWIPILQASQGGQLWNYLQAISAYTSPPWCVVFLLAVFWKRTTEAGAFWGLMISAVVGLSRLVVDFAYPEPPCGSSDPDNRPSVLSAVHFLHYAIILAFVSFASTVIISLMTQPRRPEQLRRVTYWTRHDPLEPEITDSEDDDEDDVDIATIEKGLQKKTSAGRKVYNWFCGISDKPKPKISAEEKAIIRKKMTSLDEDPYWSKIVNIIAIVTAVLTAFLLGFWG